MVTKEPDMKLTRMVHFVFILLFTTGWLSAGSVALRVDKQTVAPGEGVNVILTVQGKNSTLPTIHSIGKYPVGTPSVSQKIQATYVNGSLSSLQEKVMRFTFFPDANVTIPALTVTVDGKTQRTSPLAIHVRIDKKTSGKKSGFDLQMVVSKKSVVVGEPLVLQVIFFEPRTSEIAQAQYIAPKFDGFFVKSSKNERLEQTTEGTAHVFDYILTPQKAGHLTVTAAQIKIGIKTFSGKRDPWGFFNNEVHWRSLSTKPVTFTVKPLSVPADLVGDFTLHARVDTLKAKPNKPINYTLTLKGKGSLEELDEPIFDIDGVTVYSDDAQSSIKIENSLIVSQWVKKYTFIADHDFTIPALKLTAYDPKTGKTKTLSTQPYAVHIKGGTPAPAPAKSSIKAPASKSQNPKPIAMQTKKSPSIKTPDTNRSILEDTAFYIRQAKQLEASKWPWWSLLLAFFGGVIATLIVSRLIPKRLTSTSKTRHRNYTTEEALDLLYPHTNDTPEIEKMVRDLYRIKRGENVTIDKEQLQDILQSIMQ
jgi:hypothetical protein